MMMIHLIHQVSGQWEWWNKDCLSFIPVTGQEHRGGGAWTCSQYEVQSQSSQAQLIFTSCVYVCVCLQKQAKNFFPSRGWRISSSLIVCFQKATSSSSSFFSFKVQTIDGTTRVPVTVEAASHWWDINMLADQKHSLSCDLCWRRDVVHVHYNFPCAG